MATLPTNIIEGQSGHVGHTNELHTGHNLNETHRTLTTNPHAVPAALSMGRAGAIPASVSNEQADFIIVVPFNVTLLTLRATAATAPTAATTFQLRRSTDSGATWANAFGTVSLAANGISGSSDPADLDLNAGDLLNFSVTAGGGTGTNVLILAIGRSR